MAPKMFSALLAGLMLLGSFWLIGSPVKIKAQEPDSNPQQPARVQLLPGTQVMLRHDDRYNPFRVAAPRQAELGIQSAPIAVNYNPASCSGTLQSWPTEARNAFNYAVQIWAALLESSQTITIDACWRSDMAPDVLGSAGPERWILKWDENTYYPVALYNTLSGTDFNGATAEIKANFNRNFNWYYGTDGKPLFFQTDFVSVVLHEVAHGLGFAGDMEVNRSGFGYWGDGFQPDPAFIYDRFTEDNGGQRLLSYANYSFSLGNTLTSNAVFFDGPQARAANGGQRVPLYVPSTWEQGSSYSHLAESFNNTPNALMTYSLANGEAEHDPGPVTLGIFEDMGWSVTSPPPATDLSIIKQLAAGSVITSAARVTYTITLFNEGTEPVTDTILSDTLSPHLTYLAGSATAQPAVVDFSNFPTETGPFTVEAQSSLIVTYAVQVGPVDQGDVITNTATISAPALAGPKQSTNVQIVDPIRTMLPLINRNK